MKQEYFMLSNKTALTNCITAIREKTLDGNYEVKISQVTSSKTLKQLGGVFGVWIEHLSKELGESQDYLHRYLKSKFLSRIYVADASDENAKKYAKEIDMWVELLYLHQMNNDTERRSRHAKRISLSWANIPQMKRYMNAIESHYMAENMPLPILDEYGRYKNE